MPKTLYKSSVKERKEHFRDGIAGMLSSYTYNPTYACLCKQRYSFNGALAVASWLRYDKGVLTIEIYFCLHCFRFHIGKNKRLKKKYYCVWCGSWIKPSRLSGHMRRVHV